MTQTFSRERLQELRTRPKKPMTLEELAKKIGSTKSYVWELENKPGIRPSAETAYKLAKALGVTVEELMDDRPANAEDQVFFRDYKGLKSSTKKRLKEIMDALKKADES